MNIVVLGACIAHALKPQHALDGSRAEGRMLQAVREPDAAHRLAGHTFGAQEGWHTTPAGLLNCQWRDKAYAPCILALAYVSSAGAIGFYCA